MYVERRIGVGLLVKIGLIIVILVSMIILSNFLFTPHQVPTGSASNTNPLLDYAITAWKYFSPGVGVDPNTGLLYAVSTWPAFTDWDIAGYMLAVLAAGDIGLISVDGEWGVKDRIGRVLDFLASRSLSSEGYPFWGYSAVTGAPLSSRLTTPSDAGRLLIALHKVKVKFPEFADMVDYIVYNKTNFEGMADRVYKVQELRHSHTGKYTAFSEGKNSGTPSYVYEWIVQGSRDKLWTVTTAKQGQLQPANIPPIAFTKIGISFYAIYGTNYGKNIASFLASKTATSRGFYSGVDEKNRVANVLEDKTNSMIVCAANYAGVRLSGHYTLSIKVLDWDGVTPLAGAHVYVSGLSKYTDSNGIAVFNNVAGSVSVSVYYMGVLVADNIQLLITGNVSRIIKTNVYDVNLFVHGRSSEEAIVGVNVSFLLNGSNVFKGVTDGWGYLRIDNLPDALYTVWIFNDNMSLSYYFNVSVVGDELRIDLFLSENSSYVNMNGSIIIYS